VDGDDIAPLVEPLKQAPGVLSVAAFGSALHVAGRDAAALERAIAPWRDRPGLHWQRAQANLEDVFISLIGQAQDNYAGQRTAA
jgi:ABC-2 type transport system ATP-binding protein